MSVETKQLTTLELAAAIAQVVLNTFDPDYLHFPGNKYTEAVFRVLRENGAWFCKFREHPEGGIIGSTVQQMELWP